ncbi:MAG: PilW family protein [Pseudomonadota bacterium]
MFKRSKQTGVSLIELLITLVIGTILMAGAMRVFQQSKNAYRVNESSSRLQENARFAMDTLDPDIRLSSNWGLTNVAEAIDNRTGQPGALPAFGGDCALGFYTDVMNQNVLGLNGTPLIAGLNGTNAPLAGCIPGASYQPGTDVLVIRHASANPVVPTATGTHLQSIRGANSRLFSGNIVPAMGPASQTFRLLVHTFYVNPNSPTLGAGVPSLRRVRLADGPVMIDEEVIPGVEDFQFQFGIDTTGDLSANRYINADNPMITPGSGAFIPFSQIVSVRLWLRMRADRVELAFDGSTENYVYADQNFTPPANDGFRRLLVTKTVLLNNTRLRSAP